MAITAHDVTPSAPVLDGPSQPVRTRRLRIVISVAASIFVIGMLPTILDLPPFWKALGLGLVLPGGGLIYTGDYLLAAIVIVGVALSASRIMDRGDYVSAPLLALVGAVGAALLSPGPVLAWASWAVPAVVIFIALGLFGMAAMQSRISRRTQTRRAAILATAVPRVAAVARAEEDELSGDELAFHRWMLDHALREKDDWSSFDWRDQFTLKSVRYQLNFLQWSLALASNSRTPAFSGYSHLAQRNLIDRMTDRKVWSYWQRENMWGNLKLSADPIAVDNIMFSGYLAFMLGSYVATTGDRHYDTPGSLRFQWNDSTVFEYDHEKVVQAVRRNFEGSQYGLFACEPGLIFPICNTVAMLGLTARDAERGSDDSGAVHERFLHGLTTEFMDRDGDFHPIIFTRFGIPFPNRSSHASAQLGFLLSPVAPELTERWWTIAREEIIAGERYLPDDLDGDGDKVIGDWGTGKASHAGMYMALMACARELGDHETYAKLVEASNENLGWAVRDGVGCYEDISVNANALLGLARFGRAGAFDKLVHATPPAAGPRLADANYPDVLVAKAVTDGAGLDLVLHSGIGATRATIRLDGLRPGAEYDVAGAVSGAVSRTSRADGAGGMSLEVDLGGRTPLTLAPR